MTASPADIVRRVYERWAQGDFSAGSELFDDASVFILRPEFPDTGIYVGSDDMQRYMHSFLGPWEKLTITLLELTEVGDSIVAKVEQMGAGELSGAMTGFSYFQVWSFRGETLLRLENFMHREQADRAVGERLG